MKPPVYNFWIEAETEPEDHADICDEDYGEVVDNRLPNIILDHKESRQSHPTNRDSRDQFPDILHNVSDNTQRTLIPVIVINDTSTAMSDDDEMEDYYDNHKGWPPGSVR